MYRPATCHGSAGTGKMRLNPEAIHDAPERMKFGIFLAPFHELGENPTLAIHRDLELIEWLDHSATTKPGSASTTVPAGDDLVAGGVHRGGGGATKHIKLAPEFVAALHTPLNPRRPHRPPRPPHPRPFQFGVGPEPSLDALMMALSP